MNVVIESMNIRAKLNIVQTELKAPKNQKNDFGNFRFRSNEDILEAAKPLLSKVGAVIVQSDEIKLIGTRFYVMATSTLIDCETGEELANTAYAREPDSQTSMGDAQITGSTSSYARKYSLNGLLLIDDNKDADTMDNSNSGGGNKGGGNKGGGNNTGGGNQGQDDKPWLNDCAKLVQFAKHNNLNAVQAVQAAQQRYKISNKMKNTIIDSMNNTN